MGFYHILLKCVHVPDGLPALLIKPLFCNKFTTSANVNNTLRVWISTKVRKGKR